MLGITALSEQPLSSILTAGSGSDVTQNESFSSAEGMAFVGTAVAVNQSFTGTDAHTNVGSMSSAQAWTGTDANSHSADSSVLLAESWTGTDANIKAGAMSSAQSWVGTDANLSNSVQLSAQLWTGTHANSFAGTRSLSEPWKSADLAEHDGPPPPPEPAEELPLFEQRRADKSAVAVWTVHIHFPAFGALPEKNFYWATTSDLNDDLALEYNHVLTECLGRHQRDRGNDYAQFSAANAKNILYNEILPYADLMEKAYVVIRECYEVASDYFETEIKFKGYLKSFDLLNQDNTLSFTANSDMSRTGFLVGGRILTRERCGTEFNFNGLASPLFHKCGWQTAQGGNPLFCSKLFDGADGCKSHNNTHRFYAVEALKTADIEVLPPSFDDETGFSYETGPCFTDRMFMLMDMKMNVMSMKDVRFGMSHVGFDAFNKDVLVQSRIKKVMRHKTNHFWIAKFESAHLETAQDHLFYLGSRLFAPVAMLGDRLALGIDSARKTATDALVSLERVICNDWFYEFHTESFNYIVTDKNKQFFYFVHNLKPRTPGEY